MPPLDKFRCNLAKTDYSQAKPTMHICVRLKGHTGMHWDEKGNQWIKEM